MSKFMDKVYTSFGWITIILSMLAYFFFKTLSFEGTIDILSNPSEWLHLIFVVFLNVVVVGVAVDSGFNKGIQSEEFDLADALNNEIIRGVNNDLEAFYGFVDKLNEQEIAMTQKEFLLGLGKKYEELTKKELKRYRKLKPIRHSVAGFNKPIFYKENKSNVFEYKSIYSIDGNKKKAMSKKVFTGVLLGAITVSTQFALNNVVDALISLLIISSGLLISFTINYVKPITDLRYSIPKKVIFKKTLWDSFLDYKKGQNINITKI